MDIIQALTTMDRPSTNARTTQQTVTANEFTFRFLGVGLFLRSVLYTSNGFFDDRSVNLASMAWRRCPVAVRYPFVIHSSNVNIHGTEDIPELAHKQPGPRTAGDRPDNKTRSLSSAAWKTDEVGTSSDDGCVTVPASVQKMGAWLKRTRLLEIAPQACTLWVDHAHQCITCLRFVNSYY